MRDIISSMFSISYGGAGVLAELRQMFWKDPERFLIRVESARANHTNDDSSLISAGFRSPWEGSRPEKQRHEISR